MLHETQRTSAPRSVSVSMSTAVWMVMCSEPMIFAPLSGCLPRYSSRVDMRPGISCSAKRISLRPHSASARSFTLKGGRSFDLAFDFDASRRVICAVPMNAPLQCRHPEDRSDEGSVVDYRSLAALGMTALAFALLCNQ